MPIHALEPRDRRRKVTDPSQGDHLIQGDNLAAMRALLPYFEGAVKLIYMDPPYNTGNTTWIYNDAMDSSQTRAWLNKEVGPEDLARSDKWLCMMLPRIEVAWDLLRPEDGVLVVSIDDAELANLTVLLDERFGRQNHLATVAWKTKASSGDADYVSTVHEYLVIYARSHAALKESEPRWRVNKPGVDEVLLWEADLMADRSLRREAKEVAIRDHHRQTIEELTAALLEEDPDISERTARRRAAAEWDSLSRYVHFDQRGLFQDTSLSWPRAEVGPNHYVVLHPKTKKPCQQPENGWRWVEETMRQRLAEDRVFFGPDETTIPRRKTYIRETEVVPLVSVLDIPGKLGSIELTEIVPNVKFPFPKPVPLLQQIVELTTGPGDLILDPFVGSGTTAHAILALNAANPDDEPRRWVCVEVEPDIERTVTVPRLDRVIEGYRTKKGDEIPATGGSYSRWRIGEPFRTVSGGLGKVSKRALASVLAAHHCGDAPYAVTPDDGRLVADGDAALVFLFYGDADGEFGETELEEVVRRNGGRDMYVYAERLLIDENEAEDRGVIALQLPYDLPIAP
jgi:DNA modification methylase